jgi:TonB family protein
MNRTTRILFVAIVLMVSGCSNQSQVQATDTSSTPKVVQAAAVSTAGPIAPQPTPETTSKSGLLTPHPSAGQHVDDRDYLISSDQNYTVGAQIVTGSGEMLFTRLAIKNQTASPAFFDLNDVTIDAPGRKVMAVPRETLAIMLGSNPDTQSVLKKLLSDYWDNRTVLAPGSQEEHFLLAVCGTGCPMPVRVHVAVGGRPHDFTFGDAPASNASTSPQSSAESTQKGKVNPDVEQALADINQHFIPSPGDTLSKWGDHIALSAKGNSVVNLVHTYDGKQRATQGGLWATFHGETSARISDLDIESISTNTGVAEGFVAIDCKEKTSCVSWSEDGTVNRSRSMTLGEFAPGYSEEVAGYLRRVLLLEQGKAAPEIKHQPTAEEIVTYIRANVAPTARLGSITLFNRNLSVERNELVETEDAMESGKLPAHVVIRANFKELNGSVLVEGSDIGLTCKASPTGGPVNCISDSAGDTSWNTMIRGVSNAQGVAKMLERLILLHNQEPAEQRFETGLGPFKSSSVLSELPPNAVVAPSKPAVTRVQRSADVQQSALIYHVDPIYPTLARQSRLSGTVRLNAIIGTDGTVHQLEVVSGRPLLVQAALDAVKQWRYKPTLVGGVAVEVETTFDIVFSFKQ